MKVTSIYGLFDPRDPERVMYVGKGSARRALSRWKFFLNRGKAGNALLRRWFEQLKAEGVEPGWRFLAENVVDWQQAERDQIAAWRVINPALCNFADGGEGVPLDSCQRGGRFSSWAVRKFHKEYPEVAREAGRKGGYRLKELHPEVARESGRKGSLISNWSHVNKAHPEMGSRGGSKTQERYRGSEKQKEWGRKGAVTGTALGHHIRWHSRRGILKSDCDLCLREYAFRSDFYA